MDWGTTISTTIAALLTLAVFSFLYRDNPFYKIAEHLVVGVSAGYWMLILYHQTLKQKAIEKIFTDHQWWYVVPLVLGIMMLTRLVPKWSWVSRYPLAIVIGIGAGVAIPLEMKAKVIEQLNGTVDIVSQMHDPRSTLVTGINGVIVIAGIMTSLVYFFFSKEHKGATGFLARIGIAVLMVGFGASFGFTVMARVALLIQRLQFLIYDWLHWT
ncbi:MAG: hypothetical protein AB1792_11955 [Candidatus Zixiibacteriota bacterium]